MLHQAAEIASVVVHDVDLAVAVPPRFEDIPIRAQRRRRLIAPGVVRESRAHPAIEIEDDDLVVPVTVRVATAAISW